MTNRLRILTAVLLIQLGCGSDLLSDIEPMVPQAGIPGLAVTPLEFDFGNVTLGCAAATTISVTNIGDGPLTISEAPVVSDLEIWVTSPNSESVSGPPYVLSPGSELQWVATFMPARPEVSAAVLDIHSDGGDATVAITGTGAYATLIDETFEVDLTVPVDILFAVDLSGSMDDDAESLALNFSTLINTLSNASTDWQVGVVTEDDGCFNNGILSPDVPDHLSQFTSAVTEGGNAGGEGLTEALLALANKALDSSVTGGCNEGFLRDDALLHVVMVTDEQYLPEQDDSFDWSCLCNDEGYATDWQRHTENMRSMKADPEDFRLSGVINPDLPDGYREAIATTAGMELSLFEPWGENIDEIANASLGQIDSFVLEGAGIVPSSIELTIDGTERDSGWAYNPQTQVITLEESVISGTTVVVSYGTRAGTDQCGD